MVCDGICAVFRASGASGVVGICFITFNTQNLFEMKICISMQITFCKFFHFFHFLYIDIYFLMHSAI